VVPRLKQEDMAATSAGHALQETLLGGQEAAVVGAEPALLAVVAPAAPAVSALAVVLAQQTAAKAVPAGWQHRLYRTECIQALP
jgi:hypothetical protein